MEYEGNAPTEWVVQAVAEVINLLALVAAPRLYARESAGFESVVRTDVQRTVADTLRALSQLEEPRHQRSGAVELYRKLAIGLEALSMEFDTWSEAALPPAGIVERAREILQVMGVTAPPEGWDAFLPEE